MRKIIVGVDESAGAASALQWAVAEGTQRGWPVEAVLAWGLLNQHHTEAKAPFDPDYTAAKAAAALDHFVRAAVGDAEVEQRVVNDLPARALLDVAAADDVSLLVVGGRAMGGVRAALLGSVSYECLHRSQRPIAVVRAGMDLHRTEPGAPQHVVVGVDGSGEALAALAWAVEDAAAKRARVEVVHAWHVPYVGTDMYGATLAIDPSPFEDAARQLVETALDSVDTTGLVHSLSSTVTHGGAATAVLTAGKDADLIVMGSRGLGGFGGLLLGSATNQVVHHAPCPVVVIPRGPDDVRDDG
jgi:nucleotide-binding universal stress UspA family protein